VTTPPLGGGDVGGGVVGGGVVGGRSSSPPQAAVATIEASDSIRTNERTREEAFFTRGLAEEVFSHGRGIFRAVNKVASYA
jgi:hypothetical protein